MAGQIDERAHLIERVYLVAFSDWDTHYILSAWTTEDSAIDEAKRLTEGQRSAGSYDVEGFPLDKVPS